VEVNDRLYLSGFRRKKGQFFNREIISTIWAGTIDSPMSYEHMKTSTLLFYQQCLSCLHGQKNPWTKAEILDQAIACIRWKISLANKTYEEKIKKLVQEIHQGWCAANQSFHPSPAAPAEQHRFNAYFFHTWQIFILSYS
jgi:anthranilate/para-aminobenzoate synthase component I